MASNTPPTEHPITFVKGRGAGSNRPSRYRTDFEAADEDIAPADVRTEVTEREARSILNKNKSPDLSFDHTLNPYQGCEHGCVYCFARPTHAYLGLSPGLDFETKLFAKTNAAALLRAELNKKGFEPGIVALGASTDAYQPIDRKFKLARQVLEVMAEFNVAVAITTKNSLVTRDLDILAPMAKKNLVRVHMSIPTLDHELSRRLDPRANSPTRRLEAIQELTEAGVPVSVFCAPLIPLITDHELEPILEAAAARGASTGIYTLIRLPREVRDLFEEWLMRWYPDKAAEVMRIIREMHEGRDYDPTFGKRMTGTGDLAQGLRSRLLAARSRLGLGSPGRTLDTALFRGVETRSQGSLF